MKILGQVKGKVEDKRFRLPGVKITDICPDCKQEVAFDGDCGYISYPKFGEPCMLVLYCRECDVEVLLKIQLDITIKEI